MAYLTRSTPARPRGKRLVEQGHVTVTPDFVTRQVDIILTAANDETGADIYYRLTLQVADLKKVRRAIEELDHAEIAP